MSDENPRERMKTRRMPPPRRWLVRKEGVDYGPFTVEEILAQIDRREVGLGTLVCDVSEQAWENAATHALFRDYYDKCVERWSVEEAEAEAAKHEEQIRRRRLLTGGAWRLAVVSGILIIGAGGWLVWRLMHAQPTGILNAVAVAKPVQLPPPPDPRTEAPPVPPLKETIVPTMLENETYDTRGIGVETGQAEAQQVQAIDFAGSGGSELSEAAARRIAEEARRGLSSCAREVAIRLPGFKGTRVKFVIQPGRLVRITVGAEVQEDSPFKACVKQTLGKITVPRFNGQERRVTVPLTVRR
ncbi:MAG: hypothetical protein VX938_11905 [Myxococcota bacterium]|nr:hypothetical protein [Myxococcota bacterium]MEE2778942.1 hypothetical protein [Myxococcota bacterium]